MSALVGRGHLDLRVPDRRATNALLGDPVQAERRVLLVRWLGIGVAVLALPFLHLGLRMWLVVLGATLYNVAFQFYVLPHRPGVLRRGYLTTAGDALLSAAAVYATGGLRSEFFLIYFLVAVVAAIRFGGTAALVSTAVALLSYTAICLELGAPLDGQTLATILLRIGFVGTTGVFVGYVGDRARAAEAALQRELDQAQQRLTAAGEAIAADLDLARALEATADWALRLGKGRAACVCLRVTEEVRDWVNQDAAGLPELGQAARPGAEDRLEALAAVVRATGPAGGDRGAPAGCAVVPLTYGAQEIGALAVALGEGGVLDGTLRALLESFALRAAAALTNARSFELVRRQASTDPTTGIANHRRFKQRLAELRDRTPGTGGPTSLIMIDLDFFKEYNDSRGHQAGDRILRCIAQLLAATVGDAGLAARYGGDEFVILLPDTDLGGAVECAERVLDNFNAAVREGREGLAEPVSLSAGVASLEAEEVEGGDPQVLIGRADLAMYMAKRAGGGRVWPFEADLSVGEPLRALVANIATHLHRGARFARRSATGRASERGHGRDHGPTRPTEAVRALVAAIGAKDPELHWHCRNVARLSIRMARTLGLSEREVQDVGIAGLLHDVGKIGVPDAILQKPGQLDPGEFDIVHRHAVQGSEILDMVPGLMGVAVGVKHHHEQYDGGGYPQGLEGDAIPIAARIVAAADAYDAITADRPYRPGRPPREALRLVMDAGGRQFDPRIVAALAGLVTQRLSAGETAAQAASIARTAAG